MYLSFEFFKSCHTILNFSNSCRQDLENSKTCRQDLELSKSWQQDLDFFKTQLAARSGILQILQAFFLELPPTVSWSWCWQTSSTIILQKPGGKFAHRKSFDYNFHYYFHHLRACLHGGGGPQICEVTCGGSPHLSCKRDQIKMKDYMNRRITSPTLGPPPPCKQALSLILYQSSQTTHKRPP